MAPPKPKASPEQLALQDQLIAACKQGDEKAVKALLQQGAKPDIANAKGELAIRGGGLGHVSRCRQCPA